MFQRMLGSKNSLSLFDKAILTLIRYYVATSLLFNNLILYKTIGLLKYLINT